jgi:Protein of unknown function (DUF3551)
MRTVSVMVATFATLTLSSWSTEAAPWCARYPEGASNCGFYTFAQCQATVSGRGGFCDRNAFEAYGYSQERPARRSWRRD